MLPCLAAVLALLAPPQAPSERNPPAAQDPGASPAAPAAPESPGARLSADLRRLSEIACTDRAGQPAHAAFVRSLAAQVGDATPAALVARLDLLMEVAWAALPPDEARRFHDAAVASLRAQLDRAKQEVSDLKAQPAEKGSAEAKANAARIGRIELAQAPARRMLARLEGPVGRGEVIGRPLPALECEWVRRADGTEPWKQLADLRGRVVVLDFWATWCGPCVASFPKVAEMRARFPSDRLEIVGVTSLQGRVSHRKRDAVKCKDDPQLERSETLRFMQDMGMTWTVAFTRQPVFNKDLGISGIPSVTIVDRDGTVARCGLHPSDEESIRATVEMLLAKPAPPAPVAPRP